MKFGYTILYVDDVAATIAFYERAFGLKRKMVVEGEYGELATGGTALAFAARSHIAKLIGIPLHPAGLDAPAAAVEIGLVTDDVAAAFERATAAGATPVASPTQKPWGQTVAYVRDADGFLIELCTPME